METHQENKMNKEKLLSFIKRDFVYIVLCLIVLLACAYTLYAVGDYQQTCNQHWSKQFEKRCPLIEDYTMFNQSFNLIGGYNENKIKNQNT